LDAHISPNAGESILCLKEACDELAHAIDYVNTTLNCAIKNHVPAQKAFVNDIGELNKTAVLVIVDTWGHRIFGQCAFCDDRTESWDGIVPRLASDLSRMICFPCLEKHEPTLAKALEILYAKNSGLREFWHAEQEKNWTVEPRIVVRPVDQETADFLNSPDAEELLNAIPGIVADMEKEKRDIALRCDFCSDIDLQTHEVRVTD